MQHTFCVSPPQPWMISEQHTHTFNNIAQSSTMLMCAVEIYLFHDGLQDMHVFIQNLLCDKFVLNL